MLCVYEPSDWIPCYSHKGLLLIDFCPWAGSGHFGVDLCIIRSYTVLSSSMTFLKYVHF